MADSIRYVVLTERKGRHHVALSYNWPIAGWCKIVATFSSADRADAYANLENDLINEHMLDEEKERPPLLDEPKSALPRVVEHVERRIEARLSATTYSAASGADRPMSELCDAILGELPRLLEDHPKGVTAKAFSASLHVEERQVRQALRMIERDGRAAIVTRKDTPANHLVPLDYEVPPEALSEAQKVVLAALWANATEDDEVRITNKTLSDKTTISGGPLSGVLAALVDRGRIVIVEPGQGTVGTLYSLLRKD